MRTKFLLDPVTLFASMPLWCACLAYSVWGGSFPLAQALAGGAGGPVQQSEPSHLNAHELAVIAAAGSSCLCMIILVLVLAILLLRGKINPELLGTWKAAGTGTGLAGVFYIFYLVIKASLQ